MRLQWRSFSNERKTVEKRNFIDGDLIEAFLDLPHDRMEAIARSVGMSVEDLVKRIESLTQSLH
jgi:DNA damage-binding protein 1